MSQRDRRSSLDKLSASALSMGALSIPSLKKKKTALVALGAVLLVGCFLIVYNRAEYYNWRSHDALYASRLEACEEGVREGKVSFWLKNMRDDDYVCQMYAETYREMVGDVGHGVPKIIHQSWKSVDVPDKFRVWLSSWREANPDYEYWFWTDVENREMVETYYPQFLETYGTYPCSAAPRTPRLAHTIHPRKNTCHRCLSRQHHASRLCPRAIYAPVRGCLCGPGHVVSSARRFALVAGVSESVRRGDGPRPEVSTQHSECMVWLGAEPPVLDLLLQVHRGNDDHPAQ